ncbi:MAG: M23 family metallopeptidase [Lachnospiraceae bacterium]|nr:M23 family metallopeptidase [Lachnospiraceae bacterium]
MGYKRKLFNDKTVLVAAAAGVVAVSAILGTTLLSTNKKDNKGQSIVNLEEGTTTGNDYLVREEGTSDDLNLEAAENENVTAVQPTEKTSQDIGDDSLGGEKQNQIENDTNEEVDKAGAQNVVDTNFGASSKLIWPVEGNVIIGFDMNNTVYFSTLDLYKCSDAVYIQSDVGTPVYAGHACQVEEIGYDTEIGNNVTVEMGGGYVVTYGQLRDVQIEKGATLEEGELIGYVASPTKYFSVEGAHLYIKMTKDGVAVDPLDYLNY